jgi:hypothetical protein
MAKDTSVQFRKEGGHPVALNGQLKMIGVGNAPGDSLEMQTASVTGHLSRGISGAIANQQVDRLLVERWIGRGVWGVYGIRV